MRSRRAGEGVRFKDGIADAVELERPVFAVRVDHLASEIAWAAMDDEDVAFQIDDEIVRHAPACVKPYLVTEVGRDVGPRFVLGVDRKADLAVRLQTIAVPLDEMPDDLRVRPP